MPGQIVMCPRVITLFAPASAVCTTRSGAASARSPTRNVALAPCRRKIASTCGVHSRVGPSSMVSATILADGAARNVTHAAYAPGPAGAAVRAVGPSAAAACPAALPAPAPAAPPTEQGRPRQEPAAVHTSHPA